MIVSNLVMRRLLAHSRVRHPALGFGFASKPKLTGVTDSFEHMDDLFKQMNDKLQAVEKDAAESKLVPRITSQKEDVIYIKNPSASWRYNSVLNLTEDKVAALTLSLQSQQAIALLLY